MKILSLHIASFGKLQNFDLTFNSGLNVMQQHNGFGKTTLASFVRAMLYGIKGRSTKKERGADAWDNWFCNLTSGGSLTVEHNGATYRIERTFAPAEKLSVTNVQTGKPLDVDVPGEYFLGLTAESFDRSAYFPQEAVALSSNENFDTRLAGMVQNAENYDKVQKDLAEYRKELLRSYGKSGKIAEAHAERERLLGSIDDCRRATERRNQIDERLARLQQSKQQTAADIAACMKQVELSSKQVAKTQLTEQQLANRQKLAELRERLDRCADFDHDKAECDSLAQKISAAPEVATVHRSRFWFMFAVGIVLAVLAVAVGLALRNAIAGVALGVAGICLVVASLFARPAAKTLPAGEKDHYITQYFHLAEKYLYTGGKSFDEVQKELWQLYNNYTGDKREYAALVSTLEQSSQNGDDAEATLQSQQARLFQLQQQQEQISNEQGRLTAERAALNTDALPYAEQLATVEQSLADMQHAYSLAEKVSELLAQAKENLSTGYLPKLCARCQELLCEVSGNDSWQLQLDRNFNVSLRENGVTKPLDNFSRGLREIVLLCFRVALSEMLFDGAIPLLIVDDAFVNFDEQNFLRATTLLKTLSAKTQVVYLTCHARLGNLD